jgi:4-oxalocrotonate tautomerase family enzyme
MPYVHVYALPRPTETKAKCMQRLTDTMAEDLNVGKDQIHIIWHDVPSDDIAKGGVTMTEIKKAKS